MPKYLLLLFLSVATFFTESLAANDGNLRDTVYVELVTRDTVYVPIKPKTDTIYVVGDFPDANASEALNTAPSSAPTCCKPTADNPFGLDTTKFLRNDTNFIHHSLYIGADVFSALNILLGNVTIVADAELAFSRKNSLIGNFQYVKKVPSEDYTENFKKEDYSGNISQFIFGLGYRHYFRPAKTSSMIELGLNALFRHSDYTYHPYWKHDMVPTVVQRNRQGIQPYIHHGFVRRSDYVTCGFEYGFAYNILSKDGDVLKKHFMYLTDGFQFDFKVNISVGML
jgi:hypothetical protein